jgi:ribonuclease PH
MSNHIRYDGRKEEELREITWVKNPQKHANGSVLIKWGDTHVLCAATLEQRTPPHSPNGWISAEYSLLPASTHTRNKRERSHVSGRTAEIQRLIGRSLRAVIDVNQLGGYTLNVDCDVLQADGGTRCASITGAYVAVALALKSILPDLVIPQVAAVSFGLKDDLVLTDLNYEEDSQVDADVNIVMSQGGLVEIQGTAERGLFSPEQLSVMIQRSLLIGTKLFEMQRAVLGASQ